MQNCERTEAAASIPALQPVHKRELWRPTLPRICIWLVHLQGATTQNINIFSGSYHTGYILFKALTMPYRDPYEILLQKILQKAVYRESVEKQAFFSLFISPKSSANICKLSLGLHFVFSQRPFI